MDDQSRHDERLDRIDRALSAARSALPDAEVRDVDLAGALATLAVAETNRAIYGALAEILVQVESGRLDPPLSS